MFVCKECHDKMRIPCPFTLIEETRLSYGECELCGKVDGCYDCRAHFSKKWNEQMARTREVDINDS